EDAKAADLGFGGQFANDAGNGGAVAEDIAFAARDDVDLEIVVSDGEVIGKLEAAEQRMGGLDAGIEDGDFDASAASLPDKGARVVDAGQRIDSHALLQPVAWLNKRNSMSWASNAVARCRRVRWSGRKPGGSRSEPLRFSWTQEMTPRQAWMKWNGK